MRRNPFRAFAGALLDWIRIAGGREPADTRYARLHARTLRRACRLARTRSDWLRMVAASRMAPGLDERVVELPWVYERLAAGRGGGLVDIGSTLNSEFHIRYLTSRFTSVTYLNPYRDDGYRSTVPGVSYLARDARAPGLPSGSVEFMTCISVLEHMGCDNTRYGGPSGNPIPGADPDRARSEAMQALRGVLAPGASLLLTVPYGCREDHGWFVQLDGRALDEALAAFSPSGADATFFLYDGGWRVAGQVECESARYGERTRGASAVACVELKV